MYWKGKLKCSKLNRRKCTRSCVVVLDLMWPHIFNILLPMKCNDHPRSNTSVRLPVCVNKLKKWNEWNQSLEKEELRLWSSPVYTTCPGPLFVLSKARPETPGGFSLVCLMWQNSHFQVFMRLRKADKMLFFFLSFLCSDCTTFNVLTYCFPDLRAQKSAS